MMDQTVTLLVTAVCLFGTALGLRYRVYVLVPAGLAVLIISVIAQVIWKKMAGWGVPGALALLIVLNLGFVLGLFLRAGAAFWYTHKVGRLFASSCRSSTRRSDDAGRDGSSKGAGTTATIAPATSQKRVSAANADSGVAHLRQS
jgi:hypothetical protein